MVVGRLVEVWPIVVVVDARVVVAVERLAVVAVRRLPVPVPLPEPAVVVDEPEVPPSQGGRGWGGVSTRSWPTSTRTL